MSVERMKQCENCGSTWTVQETGEAGVESGADDVCPVCGYTPGAAHPDAEEHHVLSVGELEQQINTLVLDARASGIYPDAIVRVLREELEFAAELAKSGRRFSVQIIDLGPQEFMAPLSQADPRLALPRRRV